MSTKDQDAPQAEEKADAKTVAEKNGDEAGAKANANKEETQKTPQSTTTELTSRSLEARGFNATNGNVYAVIYNGGEMKIGTNLSFDNMWRGWQCGEHGTVYEKETDANAFPWRWAAPAYVNKITVTDNVKILDASGMFAGMWNIASMNLAKLNVSSCYNYSCMFQNCSSLRSLDMSGWTVSWLANSANMYQGCTSLSSVKIGSGFRFATELPSYCVNGHTDWYSTSNQEWYTASQIFWGRDCVADTYVKTAPPRNISGAAVSGVNSSYEWTGGAIKPNPTVKYRNTTLKNGTHYTVSYGKNVDPGTGTVTIQGKGEYTGTKTVKFTIVRRNLSKAAVTGIKGAYEWTGGAIKPNPTVKYGKATLKNGTHYTVSYGKNTNLGTGTVTIKGKGAYTGSKTVKFKITGRPISKASVSGVKSSYAWTGKAIKPNPTVKYGKATLKKNVHYTVSYGKNTDAGTGTVTIKGKGGYAGTKTVKFKITGKAISKASVSGVKSSYEWTGGAIKPNPTVKYGKATLKKNVHYTVSYGKNTNLGTGTVTVNGKGAYTGSKTVKFKITARSISKTSVSGVKSSYEWTGKAIKPNPTVKYDKATLKNGTHYTVSYGKNTAAGTGTVTIKGKGGYAGTKTVKFKIAPRSLAKASITGVKDSYTWTGKAIKPNPTVKVSGVTLKSGTDYTVSWNNCVNAGTATVIVTGKGNYSGTAKKNYKIQKPASPRYQLRRDTWNFQNLSSVIGEDVYTNVFGAAQGRVVRNTDNGTGGHCFGMASSTGAVGLKNPAANTFHNGSQYAGNLYAVGTEWVTSAKNMTARKYIQYNHISQYEVNISNELGNNQNNVAGLVSAARNSIYGGTPIVIGMYFWGGGHAVFPIAITTDDTSKTVISVYDSNHPDQAQSLTLYKSNSGKSYSGTYEYSDYYNPYTVTYATPSDEINRIMRGGNQKASWVTDTRSVLGSNNRYTLYSVDTDMKLTVNGREYDLSDNACYNDGIVIPAPKMDGGVQRSDDKQLYWVRDDVGEVTFTGIDENATIEVAAKTGGIEATVEAGSEVSVKVENFDDNAVSVSGDKGDEFSVTYYEDNGHNKLDEVEVTGTIKKDTVETTQEGDRVAVEGATNVVER